MRSFSAQHQEKKADTHSVIIYVIFGSIVWQIIFERVQAAHQPALSEQGMQSLKQTVLGPAGGRVWRCGAG